MEAEIHCSRGIVIHLIFIDMSQSCVYQIGGCVWKTEKLPWIDDNCLSGTWCWTNAFLGYTHWSPCDKKEKTRVCQNSSYLLIVLHFWLVWFGEVLFKPYFSIPFSREEISFCRASVWTTKDFACKFMAPRNVWGKICRTSSTTSKTWATDQLYQSVSYSGRQ